MIVCFGYNVMYGCDPRLSRYYSETQEECQQTLFWTPMSYPDQWRWGESVGWCEEQERD